MKINNDHSLNASSVRSSMNAGQQQQRKEALEEFFLLLLLGIKIQYKDIGKNV